MSRRHRHAPSQASSASPPSPSPALSRFLAPWSSSDDLPSSSSSCPYYYSPATHTTNPSSISTSSATSLSPMATTSSLKASCHDTTCAAPPLSLRDARARFATPLTSPELHPDDRQRHKVSAPAPSPPPSTSAIAEFMAQMLCYVWLAEPAFPHPCSPPASPRALGHGPAPSAATPAQLVPSPDFVKFIHTTLSTTQVSSSVVLLALLFVHRLKTSRPIVCKPKSEYRASIVSLMLANKMLDDHTYTAKTWAEVSGLTLDSINQAEKEFLLGLNFELHVDIQAFSAWFRLLQGMVEIKERAAASRRQRSRATRRTPLVDIRSVLEGIVTPLRHTLNMKTDELLKLRRVSEMAPLARSASQCRTASQPRRPMLPLPQPGTARVRSSSPVAHQMVSAPRPSILPSASRVASSTSQASRMSWSPDMAWLQQPPTQPLNQVHQLAKRVGSDESRPSKRIAIDDATGPYRAPRQEPVREQRLPPIVVSGSAPMDIVPQFHALGVPMLPPIQGSVPRDGLQFYSLAASGGHQLMKHQPPQLPSPGFPFIFGASTCPLDVSSPSTRPAQRHFEGSGSRQPAMKTTPEMWPPRGALSQFSSPIGGFLPQHHSQQAPRPAMLPHTSAFSSPSLTSQRFASFGPLGLGGVPSAASPRRVSFVASHSPLSGRGGERMSMSNGHSVILSNHAQECSGSKTGSLPRVYHPAASHSSGTPHPLPFSTFSNAGVPGVYSHGYGVPLGHAPHVVSTDSHYTNNTLHQWSTSMPWSK